MESSLSALLAEVDTATNRERNLDSIEFDENTEEYVVNRFKRGVLDNVQ